LARLDERSEPKAKVSKNRIDPRALPYASNAQTLKRAHPPEKKRQPAENERAHDDAERPRRLVFPLHLHHVPILRGRVQGMLGVDLVERERLGGAAAIELAVDVVEILARPVTEQHRVAHATVHLLLLFVRFLENPVIRDSHDGARYPEGEAGRDQGVDLVDFELAELRMLVPVHAVLLGGVQTVEDRHEGDEGRRQPASEQHEPHHPLRHVGGILERLDDRVVTVDRNAHQVQDRARAKVHVQRVPHVAHEVAKQPSTVHLHARVEGHREHRHEHVRERERHHEIVGDDLQLPVPHHRHHHQQVAEQSGDNNRAKDTDHDHFHYGGRHVRPVDFHGVDLGAIGAVWVLLGRGEQRRHHVERGDLRLERRLRGHPRSVAVRVSSCSDKKERELGRAVSFR